MSRMSAVGFAVLAPVLGGLPLSAASFDAPPPPAASARSLDECNAEIRALNAERLDLERSVVVRYRKVDSPSSNVSRRLKVVEINREFVWPASVRNPAHYTEWAKYRNMIPECDRRQARIAAIKARIAEIEREKSAILRASRR